MTAAERDRLMILGREAFDRGAFFEAHERWEDVWRAADEPERRWIQGMIQIAAALHQRTRERPDGCRALLRRALVKLIDVPAELFGWNLARLAQDANALLAHLEHPDQPCPGTFAIRSAFDERV